MNRNPNVFLPIYVIIALILCLFFAFRAPAIESAFKKPHYLTGELGHQRYIYPTVRVSGAYGTGSGTIVYSKLEKPGCYNTYILTNHHVIANAINVKEQWDTNLQKNVKKEKRDLVYVEIFKYKELSTPVGTTKLEADIVIYSKDQDTALLKLRYDGAVDFVAVLPKKEDVSNYKVMDTSVAVGCSLGWPPLVTTGVITRKNFQIDSLPFDMSSAQIIFGNSGGGMYDENGTFVGIPSMVAMAGWSTVVTHMGLFIPVERIYEWLEEEHYDFIYNEEKDEKTCLEERKKEIEAKKEKSSE